MIDFTEQQLERYSRHILLKDVGVEGQEKIMKSKVLVIGVGGLGSPIAFYLAAAGVGQLGLIDNDVVDLSNLQRQILHATPDIGKPKVTSAARKLSSLNPEINIKTYSELIDVGNISEIISDYDFVLDGTDNFAAKFLINDACVMGNIPYSHGGVLRFFGQTMTVVPGISACYRCAFREAPPADAVPSCSEAGILGAITGILGTIQATEALKYITNTGTLLTNAILSFDAKSMDFQKVKLLKQDDCPLCGKNPSIKELRKGDLPVCTPED